MKHYTYIGLVVAGLGMGAMTAQAAEGIDPVTECSEIDGLQMDSIDSLAAKVSTMTPESYPGNFQQNRNRFVICIPKTQQYKVSKPITIAGNSNYTVLIYGLTVDSSKFVEPITSPAITIAGTGEIILQNLQATGLKAGIQVDGKATLLSALLSCDASLGSPAVVVNSNYNRIEKSSITDCRQGVRVVGNRNLLDDVVVQKTVPMPAEGELPQLGVVGVYVAGMGNALQGITVTGYRTGVRLSGSGNMVDETATQQKSKLTGYLFPDGRVYDGSYGVYISASGNRVRHSVIDQFERGVVVLANDTKVETSTLGGPLGAVVIGHDAATDKPFSPVIVSKNSFTTKETIVYVENSDKALMRLWGVEWMGKHKSASDATKADLIVGKLLDQGNESSSIEIATRSDMDTKEYLLVFDRNCTILSSQDDIPIKIKSESGEEETKKILVGEKYFQCSADPNDQNSFFPLEKVVRFHSNTPTVSMMSDDIQLAKLGDITVPSTMMAGTLDTTDLGIPQDAGGSQDGGGLPLPNDLDVHDTGENAGNSANNMTGNAATLGDGGLATAGGGVAGAGAASSGGGCSLVTVDSTPSPGVGILIASLIGMGYGCFAVRRYRQRG